MFNKKNVGEETKKVRHRKQLPDKYILMALALLCVIMIGLSVSNASFTKPFKTVVGTILVPIEKGINNIGLWFADKSDFFAQVSDLKDENEKLKEQIDDLTLQNTQLLKNELEFQRLQELLELQEAYSDYPTTGARIIAMEPNSWYTTFTIDKGSADGMAVDMNVIANGGLVGIITEVGPNYSIVQSIINDNMSVSAEFVETSDLCIINGDLKLIENGFLSVTNISKDVEVADGAMITTSHISSKYLPGILIGYIHSVTEDDNNLTKSGYVSPVVDFTNLQDVLVITQLKESGE